MESAHARHDLSPENRPRADACSRPLGPRDRRQQARRRRAAAPPRSAVRPHPWPLVFAFPVVVALCLVGGLVIPRGVSFAGWWGAVGSGSLYSLLAYWLFSSALPSVPASNAALSFYLIPLFR